MTILTWSCTEASINNEIFLNIMHAHTGTTVTLIYVTDRTPPPLVYDNIVFVDAIYGMFKNGS